MKSNNVTQPGGITQLSIRAYLGQMNIHPARDYGYYGMYYSPFRKEYHASFKVDYSKNLWYDFATGEGGSVIDLVMQLRKCSLQEAIAEVNQYGNTRIQPINPFSFHWNTNPGETGSDEPAARIRKLIPISHPRLVAWVQERKIDPELANLYCCEVHYQHRTKAYFSVGFRNDAGGYELSSPPDFKGCIPPKEITTIRNTKSRCLVFEGFWDFLSYLTLQKTEKTEHDVVVLNSVTKVQKAMDFLRLHKEIHTCLDNDEAGQKATQLIKSACLSVNNQSVHYAGYKDLNDFLRQIPILRQEV
jgi:hypothetical protein